MLRICFKGLYLIEFLVVPMRVEFVQLVGD